MSCRKSLSSMNDFAQKIRIACTECLPERAFLRRDRKNALFITNAPRIAPEIRWSDRLNAAGFIVREENGLLRLWPDAQWILMLEEMYPIPPDYLSKALLRFRNLAPEFSAIELFAQGLRQLDGDSPTDYERQVRQSAAIALRTGIGGGLYGCALINDLIRKEKML